MRKQALFIIIPMAIVVLLSLLAALFIYHGRSVKGEIVGVSTTSLNFIIALALGIIGLRMGVKGYFLIIVASGLTRILFLLTVTVLVMKLRREWFNPFLFSLFSGFFVYLIAEMVFIRWLGAQRTNDNKQCIPNP